MPRTFAVPAACATACLLGLVAVSSAEAAPPGNDNFANAQIVGPPVPSVISGTTAEATGQGDDEPDHSNFGESPNQSVWYSFTPAVSGERFADVCDSDTPTWVAVYTGTQLDDLDQIAGTSEDADDPECSLPFDAVAGTTYWIAVDSYEDADFDLAVRARDPEVDGALLDNGVVQIGVLPEGHLNVPSTSPSSGEGTTTLGLRYKPTNAESVAPGCECEGWGAADATSGETGYANESTDNGANNIDVLSFTATPTTAVSVVDIGSVLEVTHDYHPAPTSPNLFESVVTIENTSGSPILPRYRRVMDWDIEPTAFSEFSTVDIGTAARVLDNNNDGFATANPLGSDDSGGGEVDPLVTGSFFDEGPRDHGARFDFGWPSLAAGSSITFTIYYGAAGNQDGAVAALDAVQAEIVSLGQPDTANGPDLGTPNTFAFGFSEVGGTPVVEAPPTPSVTATTPGSGSNNNTPSFRGSSIAGSTVQLHTNAACTAPVGAPTPAATFATSGIPLAVSDNATLTVYAKATNDYGQSGCSGPFSYQEITPPPSTGGGGTTPITPTTPATPKCKKGFQKVKGKCVKKKTKKKKK